MTNFIKHTHEDITAAGKSIGVGYAEMAAVVAVEARSTGFVHGKLQMLYEPHKAWELLTRQKTRKATAIRAKLARAGLAYRKWGQKPYPRSISERHEQLAQAIQIAGDQAYRWISMGMGQIMGFNHKAAGYSTAKAMFEAFATKGELEQITAMARFIAANKSMNRALINHDWAGFARRYNGSGYRKNAYDTKLAAAFRKATRRRPPANAWADGVLSKGDKGDDVRALQEGLHQRGFDAGQIDGDFGPMTDQAVREWQEARGRDVTGRLAMDDYGAIITPLDVEVSEPEPEEPLAPPKPPAPEGGFFITRWIRSFFK